MKGAPPLRVAHFSDLHYGPRNLREAEACFGAAVERAIEQSVDLAVISGDSTDHALDLHAPAAAALVARVRRLADHCPVLMLQGTWSHEPPGTLAVFGQLGGRYAVHVADRVQQVGLGTDGRWVQPPSPFMGQVPDGLAAVLSCLPSLNRAALAAAVGAGDASPELGGQVAALLQGFAAANRIASRQGVPTLLVTHGTVFGSVSEHGVPMAGLDHEFTTGALFDAGAQATLLGHIHKHQRWNRDSAAGQQVIAYAGSIGRFHHGEAGDKGFLLWHIGADHADCALEPTPARRTVDIVFPGPPDADALRVALTEQSVAGAWVRLRWTAAAEDTHRVDRAALQAALKGAAGVQFEGRVVPVLRTRSAPVAQATTLAGKVRAWAGMVEARAEPLLACLEALETVEVESIVTQALAGDTDKEAPALASGLHPGPVDRCCSDQTQESPA